MTFTRQDIKGSWFIMRRVWKKTWKNSRQYPKCLWFPSKVLNTLQCTDGIPDRPGDIPCSTEHLPRYRTAPLQSTDDPSQKYRTTSPVLMVSIHSTDDIPPQDWASSTVLMASPRILNDLPLQYQTFSTVLMVSPSSTEDPPMYWLCTNSTYKIPSKVLIILNSTTQKFPKIITYMLKLAQG